VLDPDAVFVAIGGHAGGADGVGALVSTYEVFDPALTHEQAKKDADAFHAALAKQRKVRGRSPPRRLVDLENKAHRDLGGEKYDESDDADDTFQKLMRRVRDYTHKPVRGWSLETSDMERLELPNELLLMEPLDVAVVVGYTYEPPSPWAARLILVAFPDMGGQMAGEPPVRRFVALR
jgi:hypothetical protein